jgi:hypothetical protein
MFRHTMSRVSQLLLPLFYLASAYAAPADRANRTEAVRTPLLNYPSASPSPLHPISRQGRDKLWEEDLYFFQPRCLCDE